MLKLTIPKTKRFNSSVKIFYVSSESKPDENHIVVRKNGHTSDNVDRRYFCDCKDYMIRQLPNQGLTTFGMGYLCKHAEFVRTVERSVATLGIEIVSAVRETIKTVKR